MKQRLACPVCDAACALLDVVDFNKSCEEARGKFLRLAGVPIYYALCGSCGFCFAPAMAGWTLEEFRQRVYNEQYVKVDPDYLEARPQANAANLVAMLGERAPGIRHLDYGGGNGLLARLLREKHWQSASYDPFVDRDTAIDGLGKFDLVTAFEVFEHVPDAKRLMADLRTLLAPGGIILFSTLLSDGKLQPGKRLDWWYAAPRNGHISLYSRRSLGILAAAGGFRFSSFSAVFHAFHTEVPPWARHILRGT